MINWFDMPAEGLSNGGQFEVKELEVTENGTYETKGEMYNKVVVNVDAGGALIVNCTYDDGDYVLDKTYAEIYNAICNNIPCYVSILIDKSTNNIDTDYAHSVCLAPITYAFKYNNVYRVYATTSNNEYYQNLLIGIPGTLVFSVDLSTDYPIFLKSIYVANNCLSSGNKPF